MGHNPLDVLPKDLIQAEPAPCTRPFVIKGKTHGEEHFRRSKNHDRDPDQKKCEAAEKEHPNKPSQDRKAKDDQPFLGLLVAQPYFPRHRLIASH
jgi:hypothetical protein